MSFDLEKTLQSKQAYRQHLASRLVVEKLRMLDAMREREVAIRANRKPPAPASGILREKPAVYRPKSK